MKGAVGQRDLMQSLRLQQPQCGTTLRRCSTDCNSIFGCSFMACRVLQCASSPPPAQTDNRCASRQQQENPANEARCGGARECAWRDSTRGGHRADEHSLARFPPSAHTPLAHAAGGSSGVRGGGLAVSSGRLAKTFRPTGEQTRTRGIQQENERRQRKLKDPLVHIGIHIPGNFR
jgi:hypothetical protein